jgi:hypothetical protein
VKMNKIKKGELINSKTEWNYFKIPWVVIEWDTTLTVTWSFNALF